MAFDASEAKSLVAALSDAGAVAHAVAPGPTLPGINPFSHYDACVLSCGTANDGVLPTEQIARSHRPVLLIGDAQHIASYARTLFPLKHDFAIRPFRADEVVLRIARLLGDTQELAQTRENPNRRSVLIADDDETAVVLIATILKHAGFECEVARDGSQALKMAIEKKPDAVLLDVAMPEMDGFTALAALRSEPKTRTLPVIMVTADQTEADVVRGLDMGADDYILKPFNSRELVARVDRVIRGAESRRIAAH